MEPSLHDKRPLSSRMRHAEPHKMTTQLLVINIDRDRIDPLAHAISPSPNVFFTRSPSKAVLWSRLEPLDLVLMRFGEPLEASIDLLQSLVDANPTPPIVLLAEPAGLAAAERLAQQGICVTRPVDLAPEALQRLIHELLAAPAHAPQRPSPSLIAPIRIELRAPERPAAPSPLHRVAPTPPASRPAPTAPAPRPEPPAPAPRRVVDDRPAASRAWDFPFLDQLVIELAHRLKNPLVSIKTFTHLLRERFNDAEFRERFYAIVGNDVVQLNDVVDRLLEFSEFSRPHPKALLVADELRGAMAEIEPALRAKQLSVQVDNRTADGHGTPPLFFADPLQFRYLLKQLLLDSITAATTGGAVALQAALTSDGREPALVLTLDTALTSGSGGRPQDWPTLELLLAENLIERQHGAISIVTKAESAPAGALVSRRRITVTLPLSPSGATEQASTAPAPHASSAERRQIPLSIAFQERRQTIRRQQRATIPFDDRRRPRSSSLP